MIDQNQLGQIEGCTVYDVDGDKIGKAGQVYLDDSTGQPAWVTVNTGLFGNHESFVPLTNATLSDDGLTVPFDKNSVKNAPKTGDEGHLTPDEERELYGYYNIGGADEATQPDQPTTQSPTQSNADEQTAQSNADQQTAPTSAGQNASEATDEAMTLSEERLEVGTETVESGRVRLRKYVVTENVTQTVPVQREVAVLEREPITDDNREAAMAGPDISEAEHEVVLHEEQAVVQKTVEPVERVRLSTEDVHDEETVTGEVRKERVETDGDIAGGDPAQG